ncbi:hypothetical protein [Histophilus somni]|uniref:hypothetical protein n=1 Tax=Histophilus somni TaxID=731 RepID=UPI0018EC2952|nr:hypothetical protein [Histophilus somni]QQF78676.1 hypothetical protein JFL53_09345 [Histophilus somni]
MNSELKGIKSIANGDNAKIELNNGTGGNGTKSIVFTAGNSDKKVTVTEDKFSGVSAIGANKIELSPESGSTVTLAKDGKDGVKATGLSTVGLDGDNALVFKNGTSGTENSRVKSGRCSFNIHLYWKWNWRNCSNRENL